MKFICIPFNITFISGFYSLVLCIRIASSSREFYASIFKFLKYIRMMLYSMLITCILCRVICCTTTTIFLYSVLKESRLINTVFFGFILDFPFITSFFSTECADFSIHAFFPSIIVVYFDGVRKWAITRFLRRKKVVYVFYLPITIQSQCYAPSQ